jgi:hypothetical protein
MMNNLQERLQHLILDAYTLKDVKEISKDRGK